MEFHERLRELKTKAGPAVFRDPDDFASALADVMAEDEATDGEISLLVSAVRSEAVARLETMIDNHADPVRAVGDAADLLAQKQGTSVEGSRWAVASIGYALSKVDDTVVRRFPSPWRTTGETPTEEDYDKTRGADELAKTRSKEELAKTRKKDEDGTREVENNGDTIPALRRKWPKVLLVMGGSLVGLFIILAIVGALFNLGSGDSTELADVAERYAALGSDITDGANACKAMDASLGQAERLDCTIAGGKLVLTSFESSSSFMDAREETVNFDTGNRYSEQDSGVFFSQTLESGKDFLYWDSTEANQSARYVAGDNSKDVDEVDELGKQFARVDSKITFPTSVEDDDLKAFIEEFGVQNCERRQTTDPAELEESECTEAGLDVVAVRSESTTELEKYRQTQVEAGGASVPWTYADGPTEGQKVSWIDPDDNLARIYWDDESCVCYLVAISDTNDADALQKWWESP